MVETDRLLAYHMTTEHHRNDINLNVIVKGLRGITPKMWFIYAL